MKLFPQLRNNNSVVKERTCHKQLLFISGGRRSVSVKLRRFMLYTNFCHLTIYKMLYVIYTILLNTQLDFCVIISFNLCTNTKSNIIYKKMLLSFEKLNQNNDKSHIDPIHNSLYIIIYPIYHPHHSLPGYYRFRFIFRRCQYQSLNKNKKYI